MSLGCSLLNFRLISYSTSIDFYKIMLHQVIGLSLVWNTGQLIHANVIWILIKQTWLMKFPSGTKILK